MLNYRMEIRSSYVKNKTIIGLKYLQNGNRAFLQLVKNKTIIGLK